MDIIFPEKTCKAFSLRSCRSSSVNFFDFSQGNLENLVGNLEGIFRGFFLTHRTKAQKFRGKFRSIFRKKIRGSKKKSFVQNSLCRRATLTKRIFKELRAQTVMFAKDA